MTKTGLSLRHITLNNIKKYLKNEKSIKAEFDFEKTELNFTTRNSNDNEFYITICWGILEKSTLVIGAEDLGGDCKCETIERIHEIKDWREQIYSTMQTLIDNFYRKS